MTFSTHRIKDVDHEKTSTSNVFTLKMDVARSSETLIFYNNTTRRHNAEHLDFRHHCRESLEIHMAMSVTVFVHV
jgi:hypothetical protein